MRLAVILAILAFLATPQTAHADPGDRWDGIMIGEQVGTGLGLGLLGGSVFGIIGARIGSAGTNKRNDWGAGLAGAVVGGTLGALTGVTVGVKLIGDARGGNGSWGATIAGTIGGGLLALVTAPQYGEKLPPYITGGLVAVTLLAPPIIAYHLTTDADAEDHASRVMVPLMLTTF